MTLSISFSDFDIIFADFDSKVYIIIIFHLLHFLPCLKWWYISIIRSEEEKDNKRNHINTTRREETTWQQLQTERRT
nr:MAG TPA: hypothetical protein [Caudoviricetes sp.]